MVYKKYIKRGGKLYGPYYYTSVRIGNRVVSKYLGENYKPKDTIENSNSSNNSQKTHWKNKFFMIGIFLATIGIILILAYLLSQNITGKLILEISPVYKINETVSGDMKIILKAGELIPSNSLVSASLNSQEIQENLSQLVSLNKKTGSFFTENSQISGIGEGYGIVGIKEEYPEISFSLKLIKNSEETQEIINENPEIIENNTENIESEVPEETPINTETSTETSIETSTEEVQETSKNIITGNIISEEIINGKVSKDNSYFYNLNPGETIELVSGSVKYQDNSLDDSVIKIENSENQTIISTDYSQSTEGYGKEFLNENLNEIEIDLSKLGIKAEEGELKISLSYDSYEIASKSALIKIQENISTTQEINVNITSNQTSKETINIMTIQKKARLGEKVKWVKLVKSEDSSKIENLSIELPREAENINLKTGQEAVISQTEAEQNAGYITGNAVMKIEIKKQGAVTKAWGWIVKNVFTGMAVSDLNLDNGITNDENKIVEIPQEVIDNTQEGIAIEYETPAPYSIEENKTNGKEIVVVGSEEVHYQDITAYTEIPDTKAENIHLYWIVNNTKEEVKIDKFDNNNNNLIDYIEWNVPSLSNQTYELILISKAEKLNSNRTFIEDIYDLVSKQDNNFTTINSGEYIRVIFEQILDNTKDITLYAKQSDSEVEVYTENGNKTIARFNNLVEGKNTVYLTNLTTNTDTFDLKFLGNSEIDYIVDPFTDNSSLLQYVDDCGILITENATYILLNDITTSVTCLNITANNITLNLNGKTITGGVGSQARGIFVNSNFSNIANGTITGFYNGIYLLNSQNNTINNITSTSHGLCGIYFKTSLYNTLSNSISNSNGEDGIFLTTNSNNNLIINNTASSNTAGAGIKIDSGISNILTNNTLNSDKNAIMVYSISNTISYNTITSSSLSGIFVGTPANNNYLANNTITTTVRGGIWLNSVDNNILIGNTITNCASDSGYACIYMIASNHNKIIDSTLNTANTWDITLGSTSTNNTFLNVSYNLSRENIGAGSQLIRQWYIDVNVSNSSSNLQNANVSIYNVSSETKYSQLTDSNGRITQQTMIEYVNNGGTKTYETPHTINTTLTGYILNSTTINLTQTNNTWLNIQLNINDTAAPIITLISPADGTSGKTSAYNFTFNVSDDSSISNCSLIIDNSVYQIISSVGKNVTIGMYNSSLPIGSHTWQVNCTDSKNNQGNSSSRSLTINPTTTTTPPTSGGSTDTTCSDKCEIGQRIQQCSNNKTLVLKKCGNFNPDPCLEFGNSTNYTCKSGCINNTCINEPDIFCIPNWDCTNWTECSIYYNLSMIENGEFKFPGIQERDCRDSEGCEKDEVEKRNCNLSVEIEAKTTEFCNETYVELYEKASGELVSRLKESQGITEKVDINFIILNFSQSCEHCLNNIKDEDETGIDCGGSCKKCYIKTCKFPWILMIITGIVFVLYLIYEIARKKRMRIEKFLKITGIIFSIILVISPFVFIVFNLLVCYNSIYYIIIILGFVLFLAFYKERAIEKIEKVKIENHQEKSKTEKSNLRNHKS